MAGKLAQIMIELVERANAAPNRPQRIKLTKGLHIEVTFRRLDYHLRIWRDSGLPSSEEWIAVTNAWPWQTRVDALYSAMAIPPYLHGRVALAPVQEKFF